MKLTNPVSAAAGGVTSGEFWNRTRQKPKETGLMYSLENSSNTEKTNYTNLREKIRMIFFPILVINASTSNSFIGSTWNKWMLFRVRVRACVSVYKLISIGSS